MWCCCALGASPPLVDPLVTHGEHGPQTPRLQQAAVSAYNLITSSSWIHFGGFFLFWACGTGFLFTVVYNVYF